MNISINKEECIKCKKCISVCIKDIFTYNGEIEIKNEDECIECGHCLAYCPTNSVIHSSFPKTKVHNISRENIPNSNDLMELIKSRRSTRVFSKNLIPDETLKTIIEAAHRAPTAKNKQLVEFTIITNKEILSEISTYTVSVFSKIAKKLNNPFIKSIAKPFASEVYNLLPSFLSMQEKLRNGEDTILREATALLLIHSEKNRFAIQDANLAYQNASLVAESMGIGQFYTGFIIAAIDNDNRKNYLSKKLGIKGNIYAGMALGIPKFSYSKYIDKKDISINWIK